MENAARVFQSEISRVDCETESHLYELLKIEAAVPVPHHSNDTGNSNNWEFFPNKEKTYSPKYVKSKHKVSTVSDVRALYEKDVCNDLTSFLEQQQNCLMRKICDGSSNNEKTYKIAFAVIHGENPISRRAWHMLSYINPERHKHPKQYVLWHGKCIQVNGSRGGKNKFLCNYDLNKKNKNPAKLPESKANLHKTRMGLLRNSLKIKFKPGPLGKKKILDNSHQKYQIGDTEIVTLPAPVLEVSPAHGIVLEPTIANFVNKLRGESGEMSQKYVEFAVSVLGSLKSKTLVQIEKNKSISFDLNYICEQNRLLMRRNDTDISILNKPCTSVNFASELIPSSKETEWTTKTTTTTSEGDCSMSFNDQSMIEIKQIMNEMLNSVEISLNQNSMYSEDDELSEMIVDDRKEFTNVKEKPTKRKHGELDKLDVTIIKIPETSTSDIQKPCDKNFCSKGCVCESLDGTLRLKQHCGVPDCMFACKCELSTYKNINFLGSDCSEILPGLINLDKEINSKLAKEEQEFHQTIVFSGEKSILLKSRKRNWKCSNKYAEFYSKMNLKGDEKLKNVLTINLKRLPCKNIEPLCMVHNLYKCFCDGKFTESYVLNSFENKTNKFDTKNDVAEKDIFLETEITAESTLKRRKRYTTKNDDNLIDPSCLSEDDMIMSSSCARTTGHHEQKHPKQYYVETNRKILEMEKDDTLLKRNLMRLIKDTRQLPTSETNEFALLDCETVSNYDDNAVKADKADDDVITHQADEKSKECSSQLSKPALKTNLKQWFEINYKLYKDRLTKGQNNCLEAPKKGKASLQSWDFILNRYRERKNIFFVTLTPPFRTFLARNGNHPFFLQQCKNIDDIRFSDLPKYPIVIQNLITNSNDFENSFCILRGWDHCWELIGSAVKVIERSLNDTQEKKPTDKERINDSSSDSDNQNWFARPVEVKCSSGQESSWMAGEGQGNQNSKYDMEVEREQSDKSKWFVMQIENDFTEIQFFKKGFFVTYEGIQRSITLARVTGKTVRLSSKARTDNTKNDAHQYGIYAIPCISECCVFIGPYEINEPLGIEVMKPINKIAGIENDKKTRGIWINTSKLENSLVIDNPLAYMPSGSSLLNTWIDMDRMPAQETSPSKKNLAIDKENEHETNSLKTSIKTMENKIQKSNTIKPIKISKTNGFYHLTSDNVMRKVVTKKDVSAIMNKGLKSLLLNANSACFSNKAKVATASELALPSSSTAGPYNKPVAEVTPQIKIASVYSESKSNNESGISAKKTVPSMLILKPEEINEKVLAKTAASDDLSSDIEQFLERTTICTAPQDVLVISDEEDEPEASNDVWIECSNVKNFGYISAKATNDNKSYSFQLPGFKYSEFYKMPDAFYKINQVLARKIYIPRNFKLLWQVVRDMQQLTSPILTTKCLEDKRYLMMKLRLQCKNKNESKSDPKTSATKTDEMPNRNDEQIHPLMQGLEEASQKLEHQNMALWNEAVTWRHEISESLSVPDDLKEKMSEALKEILSLNDADS